MKIALLAVMVAAGAGARAEQTVAVYVHNEGVPGHVLQAAEAAAAEMFSTSGVRIEWRGRPPDGARLPKTAIVVRVAPQTRKEYMPGALAFARPYERVHVTVFWDRVREATRSAPTTVVLAHVLVHEITHLLQGVDRHSESGVMKARWTDEDYTTMARKPLPFTPVDLLLIRIGFRSEL